MRLILPALVTLLVVAPPAAAQLSYEIAFPNLTFALPVGLEHAPDGNDWLYVIEQAGRVIVFENDEETSSSNVFLDIRARVNDSGWEEGLLGLAFHPDYSENGYFYVNYTATSPRRTVVSRFERSAGDPMAADPASELVLLEFNQPFGNHNGGDLTFGPDGYLYISTGDGGGGAWNNAQNLENLLGAILRIDVDPEGGDPPDCGGADAPYSVPENSLADGPGGTCDEIFAYGLRNPWRFSFDPLTDWFWVADVGASTWEEVNIVEDGDNLAWPVMEGSSCFTPVPGAPPCNDPSFVGPVWQYGFVGSQSITGGFVYRGEQAPEIQGRYVYADFVRGNIWALLYDGVSQVHNVELFNTNLSIASFGVDMHDHLYFTQRASNGRIYTFRSESVGTDDEGELARASLRLSGPNPFRGQTALTFELAAAGNARLALFDLLGRELAVLFEGPVEQGLPVDIAVAGRGLAAGSYVARLSVDGRPVAGERVTVIR